MRIVKNKKPRKMNIITVVSLIALLLLGAWIIFAYTSSTWPFHNTLQTTSSKVDTKNPLGTDTEKIQDNGDPAKSPSQYEGEDPNTTASLTGFVSFSSVVDDNLVIRTTIDQSLNSGTCKLTLTKGAMTVTKTSDIVANPSSSTCSGFDIPTSELSSGKWNIYITLTNGNKTGTITGEATI